MNDLDKQTDVWRTLLFAQISKCRINHQFHGITVLTSLHCIILLNLNPLQIASCNIPPTSAVETTTSSFRVRCSASIGVAAGLRSDIYITRAVLLAVHLIARALHHHNSSAVVQYFTLDMNDILPLDQLKLGQ